jgi:hypothetical protein
MSDEFEGLDATEKAGIRATLIRCRVLAAKIANERRNKRPEHFVDKLSLADTPPLSALPMSSARRRVRRRGGVDAATSPGDPQSAFSGGNGARGSVGKRTSGLL